MILACLVSALTPMVRLLATSFKLIPQPITGSIVPQYRAADGGFVVAWEGQGSDGNNGIYSQHFDADWRVNRCRSPGW